MENEKNIIWRLQTNTSKGDAAEYCIRNNVAAVGWGISQYIEQEKLLNLSFETYCQYADNIYNSYDSVVRLKQDTKENNLIWMKSEGKYYLARITKESHWQYNDSDEAHKYDVCNQLSNVYWKEIGDESEIPGALTTSFIRGSAFQRIWKPGVLEYSEMIYDSIGNDKHKFGTKIDLDMDKFFSLISPSDCEDLLYSYLYWKNRNYMCIPSTNKKGTEKYEFVIVDTETGKHIYIQVKNGMTDLDAKDFKKLLESKNHESEVYLFTTSGNRKHEGEYSGIHFVHPEDLFGFACNVENMWFIPPNIRSWIEFAGGHMVLSKDKGIMFDTNNDECESYMFDNNVIAAWGASKRFLNSFQKNNFVLYYKKGYGIIAAGKVKSSEPEDIEDGKQLDVDMVLLPKKDKKGEYIAISAKKINEILKKRYFYASTRKVPFLSRQESRLIIEALRVKQDE